MLSNQEKIQRLRAYYLDRSTGSAETKDERKPDAYKRILDSFADKTNWRLESLVHRIAQETKLTEREVRGFMKGVLQDELDLGKFLKGAQGYKSRFRWKVEDGYSLIQVGLAARRESDTLLGQGPIDPDTEEIGEVAETSLQIRPDAEISICFPNDLTEAEFNHFAGWFKMVHVFPR